MKTQVNLLFVQCVCLGQQLQQMQYQTVLEWLQILLLFEQTKFAATLLLLLSLLFCEGTVVCSLCSESLLNQA